MQHTEINSFFKLLDRLFWLIWMAFLVFMWLIIQQTFSESAFISGIADVNAACAELIPQVRNFTSGGKAAVLIFLAAQFLVYALLLAIAHSTIHRFAKGRVFVVNSLSALGQLGLLVTVWPFFDLIASNVLSYVATVTGDIKIFEPTYSLDVVPIGVGMLILTLKAALAQAINLKQDQDLTI